MKIYTKTGDKGSTGLFNGARVSKSSLRVETYGTVDELNSIIGLAMAQGLPGDMADDIEALQRALFSLGSDLATPFDPPPKFEVSRIDIGYIEWLEVKIDSYTEKMPPLGSFILPGGTVPAAHLHHARTVCRRAERLIVRLTAEEELGEHVPIFLNRLSDYLFTAARLANFLAGVKDNTWNSE